MSPDSELGFLASGKRESGLRLNQQMTSGILDAGRAPIPNKSELPHNKKLAPGKAQGQSIVSYEEDTPTESESPQRQTNARLVRLRTSNPLGLRPQAQTKDGKVPPLCLLYSSGYRG